MVFLLTKMAKVKNKMTEDRQLKFSDISDLCVRVDWFKVFYVFLCFV